MARFPSISSAVFLSAALLLGAATSANAQRKSFSSDANKRSTEKILDLFKPVVAKPSQSTVSIQIDGRQVALGTIVDAGGFILTKDSELKSDNLVVKFKDGKELPAKKIASNDDYDLAMLKVQAAELTPVSWTQSKVAPVGNWVAVPSLYDKPLAIGVVSVAARTMPAGPKILLPTGTGPRGYLGIMLEPNEDGGVRITSVVPKAAAEKAGLKVDDIILAVDGKETPNPFTLSAMIKMHKPGETVTLRYRRGEQEDEIKAKLGETPADLPPDRGDIQNNMGTSRSERRTGFPIALQHDSDLKASQCGGPLVDIDGHVIGINIARGGRTDTYAIPSEALIPLLPNLMAGKSSSATPEAAISLTERIKAAEAKVKQIEAVKAAAEKAAMEKAAEKAAAEKELARAKASLERLLAQKKKEDDRNSSPKDPEK